MQAGQSDLIIENVGIGKLSRNPKDKMLNWI